jgi:2-iminobutanoate/2-iminopropanoate deaminase
MKLSRRSFELEGHGHGGAPIPVASRVGPFVATGGIRGVDCSTGKIPSQLDEQVHHLFQNLRAVIEMTGATVETILKVTIWIATPEARAAVNGPWTAMFPDADARPVRHILHYDLPGGLLVQCEALAISESWP